MQITLKGWSISTAQGLRCIILPVIPCCSGKAKRVPFAGGVFLRRLMGKLATRKVAQIFAYEKCLCISNAITRRIRSVPTRAQNASFRARMCAFWGLSTSLIWSSEE